MQKPLVKNLKQMVPGDYLIDETWTDILSVHLVEPQIVVSRENDFDDGDSSIDIIGCRGTFGIRNWKYVITHLEKDYEVSAILAILNMEQQIQPAPASNLVPLEPSFEDVDYDVFCMGGRFMPIGATAGGVTHAIAYTVDADDRLRFGRIEARPSGGLLQVTRLLTSQEVRTAFPHVDSAYLVHGPKELVLTEQVVMVPLAKVDRLARLVVPPRSKHMFELEFEAATHPMELMVVSGELRVISEPRTEEQVHGDLVRVAMAAGYVTREDFRRVLLNEVMLQAVPEKQENFESSLVTLRGFCLAHALALVQGVEGIAWRGDRSLTLDIYLTIDDLRSILGTLPSDGWVIPEKEPDAAGIIRKRTKNKGYLLVMTHDDEDGRGSTVLSYCVETKRLTLRLALSYFGENLKFIRGARLPPKQEGEGEYQFDIVTRTYQDRAQAEAWTEARALAHFRRH